MESHVSYYVEFIDSDGLSAAVPFSLLQEAVDYYQNIVDYTYKILNCYVNEVYHFTVGAKIKKI